MPNNTRGTALPTDQMELVMEPAPWDEGWEEGEDEKRFEPFGTDGSEWVEPWDMDLDIVLDTEGGPVV